jgi:TonB-dependent starch-binding outer membrane protein SusC
MRDKLTLTFRSRKTLRFLAVLLAFPVCLMLTGKLYAQEKQLITGKVIESTTGDPLPGVTVLIKGTTTGSVTDIDGNYSINAAPTDVLVFSYMGYLSEEKVVGTNTTVDVGLAEDVIGLDEVVVTGYGVQKKSDLTGAVASVSGDDLAEMAVINAGQALQGRAAGVNVVSSTGLPGSNVNIAIRGISSINGTAPLVIIDGIRGNLSDLNPADIDKVEVLKDASSAAIYGATGGNGVILVTTKKGKSGEVKTSFNYYRGWQHPWKQVEVMNSQEYAEIHNILSAMRGEDPWSSQPDTLKNYNYQDLMMRTGIMENYDFSVSGGSEKSTYYLSANYTKQQGVLKKTDYEKLNFRINSEHKLSKIIKLGENVSFNKSKRNGFQEYMFQNAFSSPFTNILRMAPYLPPYTTRYDDTYPGLSGTPFPLSGMAVGPVFYDAKDSLLDKKWSYHPNCINPQRDLDIMDYEDRNYTVYGKVYLDLTLFKGFTFTSVASGNTNFDLTEDFDRVYFYNATNQNINNDLTRDISQQYGWEVQNYINYNTTIAENHNIGLMIGTEANYTKWTNMHGYIEALFNETPEMRYFNMGTNDTSLLQIPTGYGWERANYAYFGRITYDFKSIVLLNLSLRNDNSSRFGPNYRSGTFPSGSIGVKFSELDIIKNLGFISFGKIRAGYGQTGANAPSDYGFYGRINSTSAGLNYPFGPSSTSSQGATLVQLPNYNMHWETMVMTNIGLDLSFFKNRMDVTIDYFRKESRDMLMYQDLPSTAGMYTFVGASDHRAPLLGQGVDPRPLVNSGTIRNTGVEFTVGYRKMEGDLKGNIQFNGTFQKNLVVDLLTDSIVRGAVGVSLSNINLTCEGQPMAQFYGWKTDGLFKTQEEIDAHAFQDDQTAPGDFKFVDINGDGIINTDDRTNIGSPIPKFIMGLSAGLEYKGFDINLFFEGKFGHKIFYGAKLSLMSQQPGYNRLSTVLDQYREPIYDEEENLLYEGNTNTDEPRLDPQNQNNNFRVSDYYVESGSYLRLKNLQLGYTLPVSLTNKIGIDKLRIYVGSSNLLTFTKYTGFDPEFDSSPTLDYSSNRKDMMIQGLDIVGNYPQSIMYQVGVNLQF